MLSSSTRAIMGGGESPSQTNVMDYVEIGTLGNALDFGDLAATKVGCNGMASPVRGLIHGSELSNKTIEMITIASKGNATFFGNLTVKRNMLAAASNQTRGLFAGGYATPVNYNIIDYITFSSAGNAIDFGDCIEEKRGTSGLSDSHGGLGGF